MGETAGEISVGARRFGRAEVAASEDQEGSGSAGDSVAVGCPPGPADPAAGRRIMWFALAAALVPLAVSAVALIVDVGNSYLPAGDVAMTELHVRDVGHHEVLVGLHSRWDWSHPGPVLFYLLAPFYWVTGGASIGLGLAALVINGTAVAGMLLLARRRGGTPLLLCTLLGCLLLMRTLSAEFLHDPWNLYVTVLPFALLLFLAWSMACGDSWALPVSAGVATFLLQTHIGFAVLVGPVLAWSVGALVWPAVKNRHGNDAWRRLTRAGLQAAAVLAVLWLPPLLDHLFHSPSNLTRTVRYFQSSEEEANTWVDGWRVISSQFASTPEWLTSKDAPNPLTGEPKVIDDPRLPWLLVPLALAALALWRSRRDSQHDAPSEHRGDGRKLVVVLGLVLVSGIVAVARTLGPAFDYRLRWTWVPPLLAFVVMAWAAWRAAHDRWGEAASRRLVAATVAGCLLLAGVNVVSAARSGMPRHGDAEIVAALTPPVLEAVDTAAIGDSEGQPDQVVVAEYANSIAGPWFSRALVLQLERRGIAARVPDSHRVYFTNSRVEDTGTVGLRLVVATGDQIEAATDDPGLRLLATWSAVSDDEQARVLAEQDDLRADWETGQLSDEEYFARTQRLSEDLAGASGATADRVAVFLDNRPPS